MKNLAVIPARSGSKGLADKNIKLLNGYPLIWYSIKAAIDSKCFDRIVVSTDSEKYAEIAIKCGAEIPYLRPAILSTDGASSWDVVNNILNYYLEIGENFDSVMLLQPTSPLRTSADIINAFELMTKKNAQAIISVTEMEHSPLWSNTLPTDGNMDGFISKEYDLPRQKLPTFYRYNGAIYLVKNSLFKCLDDSFSWKQTYAYIMPQERSIDIDGAFDFLLAEILLKETQANE